MSALTCVSRRTVHLYDRTFVNSKAGYGSAVAVFLAVIVFILTLIQFKLNGKGDK